MNSTRARDYDVEAKDHAAHAYAFEFDYIMHGFMMRTFQPFLIDGNALELGCYQGNFTKLLCDRFDSVDVVEASADCIARASHFVNNRATFHFDRFETFEPAQKFANIFLIHTIEHLEQRVKALANMSSWLAPGGRLFVAAPNAHAGSRQIAVAMGLIRSPTAITEAERAHGHCVTYTRDALCLDVTTAGLRIDSTGGIFFKGLSNSQIDRALAANIISPEYLEGCYLLGPSYPELCSSIYVVCSSA